MPNNNNSEITQMAAKRFAAVKHLLMSENGQVLMDMMETECNPPQLLGSDPQQTAYNCGKRDVYIYLTEILNKETGE